jgi:RNA polymerase sigma-70 factor (ECF subfamily)
MQTALESAINACQKGNLEQFTVLYDEYVKKIYDFLYYRTLNKHLAEDLTSQTFLKALERIKSYKPGLSAFNTWLYTIARNTLVDYFRAQKPAEPLDDILEKPSAKNMVKEIGAKMDLEKVEKLLEELEPEQKEIILLRVWDGLSFKEIAEVLGKSEAASKMQFGRSIKILQAKMPLAILMLILLKPSV